MADLHAVPDNDWVQQAKNKHASILASIENGFPGDAHEHEDELRNILVHAVLAGASYEVLTEVAQVCASTAFIDFPRWYE